MIQMKISKQLLPEPLGFQGLTYTGSDHVLCPSAWTVLRAAKSCKQKKNNVVAVTMLIGII